MKNKQELDTTINRYVFNRTYKILNASCSYCKWHTNENSTNKYYGGIDKITYPSWKLCSKNKKQWMTKKLNFAVQRRGWVKITW